MNEITLSFFSILSLLVLSVVYYFLISEKLNKVLVSVLGAVFLILMQVFKTASASSQEGALEFINHNMDILGFVIGMMILIGIVRESGAFESLAIWLVKLVKGNPVWLLISLSYLTLFMTALFSNIPTVLIITPIILVLIKSLHLPAFPFLFSLVTMANLGGAMTPISDPTTYYQAKTVGLGFAEVISNSGVIVLILSVVSLAYILIRFRRELGAVSISPDDVSLYSPRAAIKNRKVLNFGLPLLALTIVLMVGKETIRKYTGITLDNATITIGAAFLGIFLFRKDPKKIFRDLIDWEIIFFFMGLFVVVGALEFTHVISALSSLLITWTNGSSTALLFLTSVGSGLISTFIDNVPYNITMVSAIQEMAKAGIHVYPLWWALNLGTSIGGAGSPIAAACNVIIFGQAEKDKLSITFTRYLFTALPLVILNSLITFGILWLRYLS